MWVEKERSLAISGACVQKEDPSEWALDVGAANKLNRWTRERSNVSRIFTRHLAEILISGRHAENLMLFHWSLRASTSWIVSTSGSRPLVLNIFTDTIIIGTLIKF